MLTCAHKSKQTNDIIESEHYDVKSMKLFRFCRPFARHPSNRFDALNPFFSNLEMSRKAVIKFKQDHLTLPAASTLLILFVSRDWAQYRLILLNFVTRSTYLAIKLLTQLFENKLASPDILLYGKYFRFFFVNCGTFFFSYAKNS